MMKPDTSITEPFLLDSRTNTVHYVRGLRPECHAKDIPQRDIRRLTLEALVSLPFYLVCRWCQS